MTQTHTHTNTHSVELPVAETHYMHKRQTAKPPAVLEPPVIGSETSQSYASPYGHTASVFGRFFALAYAADPSDDHALTSVWSYCTRSVYREDASL